MADSKWKTYEKVAMHLLDQLREHLGLEKVEGKQKIHGDRSEADWEIDAKGAKTSQNEMFVIVECRRHTTARQKQEHLAGLAYRIIDTGAVGGIIVSPLGLQKGAKKIGQAEGIVEVKLNPDCTTSTYVLEFLNKVMVGLSDEVKAKDQLQIVMKDSGGNITEDIVPG